MKVLSFSSTTTVVLNIVLWPVIHFAVGFIASRLNRTSFDPAAGFYRIRRGEWDGRIYDRLFRIRKWKRIVLASSSSGSTALASSGSSDA